MTGDSGDRVGVTLSDPAVARRPASEDGDEVSADSCRDRSSKPAEILDFAVHAPTPTKTQSSQADQPILVQHPGKQVDHISEIAETGGHESGPSARER